MPQIIHLLSDYSVKSSRLLLQSCRMALSALLIDGKAAKQNMHSYASLTGLLAAC